MLGVHQKDPEGPFRPLADLAMLMSVPNHRLDHDVIGRCADCA